LTGLHDSAKAGAAPTSVSSDNPIIVDTVGHPGGGRSGTVRRIGIPPFRTRVNELTSALRQPAERVGSGVGPSILPTLRRLTVVVKEPGEGTRSSPDRPRRLQRGDPGPPRSAGCLVDPSPPGDTASRTAPCPSAVASSGAQASTTSTYPLGVTMSTRQGTWSDRGICVAMRHPQATAATASAVPGASRRCRRLLSCGVY
jgi:hypothetical protein